MSNDNSEILEDCEKNSSNENENKEEFFNELKGNKIFIINTNVSYKKETQNLLPISNSIFNSTNINNIITSINEVDFEKSNSLSFVDNSDFNFDHNNIDKYDNVVLLLKSIRNHFNKQGTLVSLFIARKKIGFGIENTENEIKKFFLINTLFALSILKYGGVYIIKLKETYSKFTISLITILYFSFQSISIIKPHSSHSITASRFLICHGFNLNSDYIDLLLSKLVNVFEIYSNLRQNNQDIITIIKSEFLKKQEPLRKYIFDKNKDIDEKRIFRLNELISEINNEYRIDYHKWTLKKECLMHWKIDLKHEEFKEMLEESQKEQLDNKGNKLKEFRSTLSNNCNNNDHINQNLPKGKLKITEDYDKNYGEVGKLYEFLEKGYNKVKNVYSGKQNKKINNNTNRFEDKLDKKYKSDLSLKELLLKENKDIHFGTNNYLEASEKLYKSDKQIPLCFLKNNMKKNKENSNILLGKKNNKIKKELETIENHVKSALNKREEMKNTKISLTGNILEELNQLKVNK